ncbi:MAG: thiol oxidoreductase, partial [Sphingobacteriales bacterium]
AENRWWYTGKGTLAEYCSNHIMTPDPAYADDLHYFKQSNQKCDPTASPEWREIRKGDKLEFEISQFLQQADRGQNNYYGTTYLYIVGEGLVPWDVTDRVPFISVGAGGKYFQRDSIPLPKKALLGGDTSLHAEVTAEPDHHFQQMANNLGFNNAQPFVLGRRIHHTSFLDGGHDEDTANGTFTEMVNKAGPFYVNDRCGGCHQRNGRAELVGVNTPLDKWVFKIGDTNGNSHPLLGRSLQAKNANGGNGEGAVFIAYWDTSIGGGLRKPVYTIPTTLTTSDAFSPRLTPQIVGVGLLEAIPEATILAKEDVTDTNNDGISGKAQRVLNPATGQTNIGRFGYKAATASVKHQIAAAFNNDMGVMTSVLPNPDCGSSQTGCGSSSPEVTDAQLNNLVKYISLLGVRPQRNYNDADVERGKVLFSDISCVKCHTETVVTSQHHPFAELRSQTIHPYTDLLLHDMGEGLADA